MAQGAAGAGGAGGGGGLFGNGPRPGGGAGDTAANAGLQGLSQMSSWMSSVSDAGTQALNKLKENQHVQTLQGTASKLAADASTTGKILKSKVPRMSLGPNDLTCENVGSSRVADWRRGLFCPTAGGGDESVDNRATKGAREYV